MLSSDVSVQETAQREDLVSTVACEIEDVREVRHYSFPFSHFLVYGIGKPLVERNLLPRRLHVTADRFSGLQNAGSPWNPFNAARAVFRVVDRLNDRRPSPRKRTFVNVLLKARKPAQAGAGVR